ncbi:MAG: oligosaccharide flippase family protein [Marinilabiliales bacterium]
MKNILVKNTILYTIGSLLPKITGFILLPVYTTYMSKADYGIIQSMQVIISILSIVFTLATERGIYRLYYDYKENEQKKTLIGNITLLIFILSTLGCSIFLLFPEILHSFFPSIPFYPYYTYTLLTIYFLVFQSIPLSLLMIKEKALHYIIVTAISFAIVTLSILYFVVLKKQSAEGMIKGQMIGNLIMLPYYIYLLLKDCKFKITFKIIRSSLAFSLPMIPTLFSSWILNLSDRIFIERYSTLDDLGVYSVGYKIAGIIIIISAGIFKAYNPYFYKIANSDTNFIKKLTQSHNLLAITLIYICFVIAFLSNEIVHFFINSKFSDAANFIPIISLAYLFQILSGLLNPIYYQEKKTLRLMFIVLFIAGVTLLLNYILIPKYGGYGAAWATVIAVFIYFVLEYILKPRSFIIIFKWHILLSVIASFIGIFFIFYIFPINNYFISLIVKTSILTFILILFYLIFFKKTLSPKRIYERNNNI